MNQVIDFINTQAQGKGVGGLGVVWGFFLMLPTVVTGGIALCFLRGPRAGLGIALVGLSVVAVPSLILHQVIRASESNPGLLSFLFMGGFSFVAGAIILSVGPGLVAIAILVRGARPGNAGQTVFAGPYRRVARLSSVEAVSHEQCDAVVARLKARGWAARWGPLTVGSGPDRRIYVQFQVQASRVAAARQLIELEFPSIAAQSIFDED